ncbi:MAG: DUF3299 domain-containing protein [Deltaproteobacteria bacterium]|jgi:hypothetical protein|nr:DUF3299 domain-containing protein [Deltaproteobacteria bacterium]
MFKHYAIRVSLIFLLLGIIQGPAEDYWPTLIPLPSPAKAQDEANDAKGQMVNGYYERNWLIWEELVPPEWKPEQIFEDLKLDEMSDNDPRVEKALEEFLKRWNAAPVNKKIGGRPIKIPGFVVPLDFEKTEIEDFLLVPYFGACIHVPPPPPNQIVYVKPEKPLSGVFSMDVVWVYGKISVDRFESEFGPAGYTIKADKVEIYKEQQP